MEAATLAPSKIKVDSAKIRALANTVRGLAIDGTNAANSGHPGLPLGAADFAITLWYHFLRFNPEDPKWPNRDKFILSGGHGSMLLYSLLHLAGYDLSMEELKNFRQWGSKTPGHPENTLVPGIETTTGPLGQGFANGVGFALADKMLAARVNRDGFAPINSYTYVLTTDGDLMEGVALEAASLGGFLGLGNLICLYDDNDISLDGPTSLSYRENTPAKFEAMGWQVLTVDGHNPQEVADAIVDAQLESGKPSLICCKTIIGYGSPKKAGTSGAHGSPLGEEEGRATKEKLGIPTEPLFHVPDEDRKAWSDRVAELKKIYQAWTAEYEKSGKANADAVQILESFFKQEIPADLESVLPNFEAGKAVPTRKAGQAALAAIGKKLPFLVGGSADLSCSTNAIVEDTKVTADDFSGRHLFFGVREHAMGAIVNGMVLQGAFRAFGATFLTFSDYMRGAIRLSALTETPSIWVYTHDSIFLGEDGPTHQPVEHVMALRAIPNLTVLRPGDAIETGEAWVAAVRNTHGPSAIVLTRQNLPVYDRKAAEFKARGSVAQGGYIFRPEKDGGKLDGILIGTGSELHLCVEAARKLEVDGLSIRVVSMPSWELYDAQDQAYKDGILPPACMKRVAVEAGISMGWQKYVGVGGAIVAQETFGASAPAEVLAEKFGFTPENVIKAFKSLN